MALSNQPSRTAPAVDAGRRVPQEPLSAVKSADRALTVLEHLATVGSAQSLAEIAECLAIPRSSLHGILRTMQGRGWLVVDNSNVSVRYRIGSRALTVGASFLVADDVVARSSAILDALSSQLGETVHLGILDNMEVIYLAKRDTRHSLRLVSGIGVRMQAYATALGKVLLAELDEGSLARLLRLPRQPCTTRTMTDEEDIRRDLVETHRRGYAIDDGESTEGVRCFAVAIGETAPRRYAISCSTPIVRLDARSERRIVDILVSSARAFVEPVGIG